MKPPLRCQHDADAVIDGIVSGVVDAIATDHAPHAGSEKMQEFERCPFGITGLETAARAVARRAGAHRANHRQPHGRTCSPPGPANILKLDRGTLAPGAPADVTIFDLDTRMDV